MDVDALGTASLAIQIHAVAAVLALVLGTAVLLRRKGDRLHKTMGRAWVGIMVVVALSSFFIAEIRMWGPYSFIHIISIFTLYAVVDAIWKIRQGNVRGHRNAMVSLYAGALVLAGAFTLAPGRRMNELLFADGGASAGILALGVALIVGGTLAWRYRRRWLGAA